MSTDTDATSTDATSTDTAGPDTAGPDTAGPDTAGPGTARRRPRAGAAAILLAVLAMAAAGCTDTGSPPAPSLPQAASFAPGVCRQLAPDLIETLRLAQADHSAPDGIATLARALVPSQEKLYGELDTAGAYAADLERVTTAVGFLRLRSDAGTYQPALLTEVRTSTRHLVDRCT